VPVIELGHLSETQRKAYIPADNRLAEQAGWDRELLALDMQPMASVCQAGDLWLLGSHRLLCGSATDAADVAPLLGGVRPHLMVSDPPYGVAYDPSWRNTAELSATRRTGKVLNDDRADWREALWPPLVILRHGR
jgi:hypothetical protein